MFVGEGAQTLNPSLSNPRNAATSKKRHFENKKTKTKKGGPTKDYKRRAMQERSSGRTPAVTMSIVRAPGAYSNKYNQDDLVTRRSML